MPPPFSSRLLCLRLGYSLCLNSIHGNSLGFCLSELFSQILLMTLTLVIVVFLGLPSGKRLYMHNSHSPQTLKKKQYWGSHYNVDGEVSCSTFHGGGAWTEVQASLTGMPISFSCGIIPHMPDKKFLSSLALSHETTNMREALDSKTLLPQTPST